MKKLLNKIKTSYSKVSDLQKAILNIALCFLARFIFIIFIVAILDMYGYITDIDTLFADGSYFRLWLVLIPLGLSLGDFGFYLEKFYYKCKGGVINGKKE